MLCYTFPEDQNSVFFFLEKPMQRPVLVLTMEYHTNGVDGLFQGWAGLRPGKQQFCYSVYLKHQFIFLEARREGKCEMFINLRKPPGSDGF